MSEFDDEEYESFELDGAGRSAEPVKKTTGSGAGGDDDLEDDDDFDESLILRTPPTTRSISYSPPIARTASRTCSRSVRISPTTSTS